MIGCKPFYELKLSKKQLKRSIKSSKSPIVNGRYTVGQNSWSIAVKNEDEIVLDTDILNCFTDQIDTCSYVQWTFYGKHYISENRINACKEPSTGTISKIGYSYRFVRGEHKEPVLIIQQFTPSLEEEIKYCFKGISENTQNVNIPGYIIHLSKYN